MLREDRALSQGEPHGNLHQSCVSGGAAERHSPQRHSDAEKSFF
jgi:hypothetical protein